MIPKTLIVGLLLITILLFSGCNTPPVPSTTTTICRTVDVTYTEQEAYSEEEPYTAYEQVQVPLKYEVTDKYYDKIGIINFQARGAVFIRNVDSETGLFTVTQTFTFLNRPTQTPSSSQYIMPGEKKYFEEKVDIKWDDNFNWEYRIEPGTKTVTQTVTRYRTVTKYRPVTRTRQEQRCG